MPTVMEIVLPFANRNEVLADDVSAFGRNVALSRFFFLACAAL
jgi:hypothetical protein